MALIGKIRKNFWFVLLLLGLALAAFVIMDMVSAGNRGGLGAKQIVGEVAGSEIEYQDFTRTEQALFSGGDSYAGKSSTWNYLIEKGIVEKEAEELGVNVSVDELMELQFGNNLSPIIQSTYTNPQTGQLDRQALMQVQQALETNDQLNPDFEMRWAQLQKQIIKTAKQDKINALVSKSIYTPNFLAESKQKTSSQMANFDYVKIPFTNIEDSSVEVSDSDIQTYINDNAHRYTNKVETRIVDYVTFDVIASKADSADIRAELTERANVFKNKKTSVEDSLYTINNEGFYNPIFANADQLTGAIKNNVSSMEVGDVYGPYFDNGGYFIAKLTGKAIVPDSIEASHILRSVTAGNVTQLAEAKSYIDSLRNVLERRTTDFATLATEHSQDPGSATSGGELGTFTQGRMVGPFNKAVFEGSKDGGLYTVTTQFGVHLIKVQRRVFENQDPKYKLAYIRTSIVPSEATQIAVYEEADKMISANRDLSSLESAVNGVANVTIKKSAPLKENDYLVGTLGGGETSREIVKWAFDSSTSVNDASPSIYSFTDPVNFYDNKYVLAGLSSVNAPGISKAADIRDQVLPAVRNLKKSEQIKSKISGTSLDAIASSFGSTVESVTDASAGATSIPNLGVEPKVLARVFATNEGSVSQPIVGTNGVYVVKTNSKREGQGAANLIVQKRQINTTNRGRVNFGLINALKEQYTPKDNRFKYF